MTKTTKVAIIAGLTSALLLAWNAFSATMPSMNVWFWDWTSYTNTTSYSFVPWTVTNITSYASNLDTFPVTVNQYFVDWSYSSLFKAVACQTRTKPAWMSTYGRFIEWWQLVPSVTFTLQPGETKTKNAQIAFPVWNAWTWKYWCVITKAWQPDPVVQWAFTVDLQRWSMIYAN